jgi:hypothetical protein
VQSLLLFLNEVAGGRKLLEAAREKAGDASYVVAVAPANRPAAGQIVDFESPEEAARSRVEVTLAVLDEFGIEAVGEVLDPAPELAIGDAIRAHRPSEVLISCLYETRFGFARRDLVEWAKSEFEPETTVTHIPVRIGDDSIRQDLTHTLVVGNQTLSDDGLRQRLLDLSNERPHRFTVVAPATEGVSPASVTRGLSSLMADLYREDIDVTGQPIATDPFSAIKNAIEHYRVDDVLISTLAGDDSKWLEDDLIGRVREYTDKPVSHLEAGRAPEQVAAAVAAGGSDSGAFDVEDASVSEGSDEE